MAAPLGNQNAAKAKVWAAAINRALERRKPLDERLRGIDELADTLIAKAAGGDMSALTELGNRLDGKPAQAVTLSGDEENPLRNHHVLEFVDGADPVPKET